MIKQLKFLKTRQKVGTILWQVAVFATSALMIASSWVLAESQPTGLSAGAKKANQIGSEGDQPLGKGVADRKLLSQDEFDKLHRLIKPQADEWRWAEVPWMPTLLAAKIRAQTEGKPLFIWSMDGEPLGQC